MVKSRADRGQGPEKSPAQAPGAYRRADPRRVVPEVLYELLLLSEGRINDTEPSAARVQLRDLRARLRSAFPEVFRVSETDMAQDLNEEDIIDGP